MATSRFVANAEHLLLFGPPGVGKTHLAIASAGRLSTGAGVREPNREITRSTSLSNKRASSLRAAGGGAAP